MFNQWLKFRTTSLSAVITTVVVAGMPYSVFAADQEHGHGSETGHDTHHATTDAGAAHDIPHDAGHAAHGDAHHGSGGLPQLDPSTFETQLFWLFVVFTALYFFYSRKSLPEISDVVENRRERIQNDLDTAQKLKSEADEVHTSYEESLAKARNKASELFRNAEDSIKQQTVEQMEDFQKRAQGDLEKNEKKIAEAKENALKEIDKIAGEIAVEAVDKIIGADLKATKAA